MKLIAIFLNWEESSGAIIGVKSPGQGTFSVADVRHIGPAKHSNEYRIVRWEGAAGVVSGAHGSGQCVQDVRASTGFLGAGKYRVTGNDEPAGTVIARSDSGQGAFAVADPKPGMQRDKGDAYLTGGHYGVVGWGIRAALCLRQRATTTAGGRLLITGFRRPLTGWWRLSGLSMGLGTARSQHLSLLPCSR